MVDRDFNVDEIFGLLVPGWEFMVLQKAKTSYLY